jgi:hypothetical protein
MNTVTEKRILQNLLDKHNIGAKHTSETNAIKCLPKAIRGDAKKALKNLEKQGYVISHPTSYEWQISLNPQKLWEIKQIIESP